MNKQEIIDEMSKKKYEMSFAVEGRWTNLRVFGGPKDDGIYMRLDCFKQYSVPLTENRCGYLEKENKLVILLSSFGFPAAPEHKEKIAEILSQLKPRQCRDW